jgi:PKD repeat protein
MDTICDGIGVDFKVIQAGTPAKAYTVSGGNNMDGPFTTIGVGNGTTDFDIGTVQMSKVRYLYIKDNGAGPSYGQGAGFNLDAVEMITPPLIVNFSASDNTPCAGTTVNFTDQSVGNPSSWTWTFQGGIPSTSILEDPGNIQYNAPGTYDVTLTITNGITSSTKMKTGFITVMPSPQVHLGNDTSICAWNTIVLDAGIPGAVYLWSTGDTTQTIVADSTGVGYGSQNYWVSVTNDAGCSGNDSINVTFDDCTGLARLQNHSSVSVLPNPAGNHFVLDIRGFEGGSWQLLSITGTIVERSGISQAYYKATVDVHAKPRGIYILKVQKDDAILVKKIIISPIQFK